MHQSLTRRSSIVAPVVVAVALLATIAPSAGARSRAVLAAPQQKTDPVPGAFVETMAQEGQERGIKVGSAFYPATPQRWVQVVVLDRKTLKPIPGPLANKSYDCPYPYGDAQRFGCVTALRKDLNTLTGEDLVIASNQPGGQPPFTLEYALEGIGVGNDAAFANNHNVRPGDFSAVGVRGYNKLVHWHAALPGDPRLLGAGSMEFWLMRERRERPTEDPNYVFAASDRVAFDTAAHGSSGENVVDVGGEQFRAKVEEGGFQVVVVSPVTLKGQSYFFETHNAGQTIPALEGMHRVLAAANHDALSPSSGPAPLVFVASCADSVVTYYNGRPREPDQKVNTLMSEVVDDLETLGGTRNAAYRALDGGLNTETQSYTLIAAADSGPGRGEEAIGKRVGGAINSRAMSGMLARSSRDYGFQVQDAPTVGGAEGGEHGDLTVGAREFTKVAFQSASEWPDHGNAGRTAAIAWIGEEKLDTPDFRGQYWSHPLLKNGDFDSGFWTELAGKIEKLQYPASDVKDCPGKLGFCPADLTWAKGELQQEIGWLISLHRYTSALAAPFGSGLEKWADLQQIANSIRDKIHANGDEKIHATGKAIFDAFRSALAAIPVFEIGHAVHAVDTVYEMIMQIVEINNEPAESDYPATVNEVGVKLADRLVAAQETLDQQLPNLVAADYQKLKTAGSCASTDRQEWSGCPFDHSDWQFTQDDQAVAAEGVRSATQIWAYGELLPARYNAYRLPLWWRTKVNDNQEFYGWTKFNGKHWYPFQGLPNSAEMAKPIYRNLPTYSHTARWEPGKGWQLAGETWQITALGVFADGGKGTIFDPWVMQYPDAAITNRLFDPPPAGLGVDKEKFFDLNFPPKRLDNYPENDAATGWCVAGVGSRTGGACSET